MFLFLFLYVIIIRCLVFALSPRASICADFKADDVEVAWCGKSGVNFTKLKAEEIDVLLTQMAEHDDD